MIKVRLDDPMLIENLNALDTIRKSGMFTDVQMQSMYDEQVQKDALKKMENDKNAD